MTKEQRIAISRVISDMVNNWSLLAAAFASIMAILFAPIRFSWANAFKSSDETWMMMLLSLEFRIELKQMLFIKITNPLGAPYTAIGRSHRQRLW